MRMLGPTNVVIDHNSPAVPRVHTLRAPQHCSSATIVGSPGVPRVDTLRIHDPNDNSNNRRGDPHFADEVAEALGEGGMAEGLPTWWTKSADC